MDCVTEALARGVFFGFAHPVEDALVGLLDAARGIELDADPLSAHSAEGPDQKQGTGEAAQEPFKDRTDPRRAGAEGGDVAEEAVEPAVEDGHDPVAEGWLARSVEFPARQDGVGALARGGEVGSRRCRLHVGEVGVEVGFDAGHQGGAFCVGLRFR